MPLFLLLLYRCAGCGATPNPHGCAVRAGICSGWLRRRAGGAGLCYTAARRVPPAKGRGQVLQAALVLPHGTFAHAEHLRCRPHGSAALHQIPPNLHGALFGVTFHRTCPPNRFSTVCGAPSVYAGSAGGPGAGMVQYVQNKYFFKC